MEWLERLKKKSNGNLKVTYKSFVLEQANFASRHEPGWKIWEDKNFPSRDMPALQAAKCAAKQGEEAFLRYNQLLFRARHRKNLDITNQLILWDVAREAGLDLEKFAEDMRNGAGVKEVAKEHEEAVKKYGMFGVPTLIFGKGTPVFVKLEEGDWEKKSKEDQALLEVLRNASAKQPYILEIKQPESARLAEESAKKYKER
jgi:predicted DsbA family dithiol-disulfide isomerase